jgi:O-antigen/teichoic acid export membrane protein
MTAERGGPAPLQAGTARPASFLRRSRDHFSGAGARSKEMGWLLFGRFAMTATNAVLVLALPLWLMEVDSFGLFGAVIAGQLVLSRMILVGVDSGMIRLFTIEHAAHPGEGVVRAGLKSTLVLSAVALAITTVVALIVSRTGVLGWHPVSLFAVAFGAIGSALFDYGFAVHLARLEYRAAGMLQAAMPITRMLLTLGAAMAFFGDSFVAIATYAAVALLFGAWQAVRIGMARGVSTPPGAVKRLLTYSKWIGLSDMAMVLGLNQGVFLLTILKQEAERGVFVFSQQLAMGFFAIYLAFYFAMLPRAARIGSLDDLPRFLGRAYTAAAGLVLFCVPVALALGWVIPMILEWRQKPELAGFQESFWLFTAFMLVLLLETPLAVTCQYLLKPSLQFFGLAARAALVFGFGLLLAPGRGAAGASEAQLFGGLVSSIVLAVLVLGAVRAARKKAACAES